MYRKWVQFRNCMSRNWHVPKMTYPQHTADRRVSFTFPSTCSDDDWLRTQHCSRIRAPWQESNYTAWLLSHDGLGDGTGCNHSPAGCDHSERRYKWSRITKTAREFCGDIGVSPTKIFGYVSRDLRHWPGYATWRADEGRTRGIVRGNAWRCGSGEVVRVMSWLKFWNVQKFIPTMSRLVTTKSLSSHAWQWVSRVSWTVRK